MAWGFKSEGNRSVIRQDGVPRVAINEDGSMELLTPPSAAPDANDVPTFGTSLARGTAQNATGTAIDFIGIPSWAKRITVMLNGVSTNGTSQLVVRMGAGSVENTGYFSTAADIAGTSAGTGSDTTGIRLMNGLVAADTTTGSLSLTNITGNSWVATSATTRSSTVTSFSSGSKTLSGPLDRIRLTTANGTDTFDAGSVNIMWE